MRPSNYPISSLGMMMMMIMMKGDVVSVSGDGIDLGVERIESAIFRSFSGRLILAHVGGRYQPERIGQCYIMFFWIDFLKIVHSRRSREEVIKAHI